MQKNFELASSMSFLIIDENESYRTLVYSSLKKLGFRNMHMASASSPAIKSLKTRPVDLIICEMNMPGLDGGQILKEVRESFEIHGTPFLMMGVNSKITKEDIILLAEYEIDGYLTKPFTDKTLIEKITVCIEHYSNPANIEYNIALAKQEILNKKYDLAFQMYAMLLDANPNSARIRVGLARCCFEIKNYNAAIEYCQQAIAKNQLYVHAYDELAKALFAVNQVDEAIKYFKSAIAISPNNPLRYELVTTIFMDKKLYKDAELILKKALENGIIFDSYEQRYGEILYFLGKPEKALLYLEKALIQFPGDKSLLNLIGVCLKDLGKFEDALKHYNAAIKRFPDDTKIMFNKALCLISLARFDHAKKILNFILTLDPQNQKIIAKLAELSKEK